MAKSNTNKTKCKCGECKKCFLRKQLRKSIGLKKTIQKIRNENVNDGRMVVELTWNDETNSPNINTYK